MSDIDDVPMRRKPGRPRKLPLVVQQPATVTAPAFTVAAPVTVSDITATTDRFTCGPYSCVLMASACVRRQDMLTKPRNERTGDYAECEGCKDGAVVRRRLQMAPVGPSAGKSAHGPSPGLTGASVPRGRHRDIPPAKVEPVPEMPKPGPMLLRKSETWQRTEPSLPPPLAEIPHLPPPPVFRHPAAVVFDEAANVTPEVVESITPVLVSDVGVIHASTPQAPAVLTSFTAKLTPDALPVRVHRVGTAGCSGKGKPRSEPTLVTEAQTRLTHIAEVYEDLERRTLGLLEAIRSTVAKLQSER